MKTNALRKVTSERRALGEALARVLVADLQRNPISQSTKKEGKAALKLVRSKR